MWARKYKDYPSDTSLKKESIETGKGLIGCEMHELFGWGVQFHKPRKKKKPGFFRTLLQQIFRGS